MDIGRVGREMERGDSAAIRQAFSGIRHPRGRMRAPHSKTPKGMPPLVDDGLDAAGRAFTALRRTERTADSQLATLGSVEGPSAPA